MFGGSFEYNDCGVVPLRWKWTTAEFFSFQVDLWSEIGSDFTATTKHSCYSSPDFDALIDRTATCRVIPPTSLWRPTSKGRRQQIIVHNTGQEWMVEDLVTTALPQHVLNSRYMVDIKKILKQLLSRLTYSFTKHVWELKAPAQTGKFFV